MTDLEEPVAPIGGKETDDTDEVEEVERIDRAAVDVDGVRPPRQERSRRTLDRITEAALALLAEHGPAGTTVQDIVRRAGSSVGSFYARFDGKEDLFRYLDERVWREARERWDRAVAEADPPGGDLEEAVGTVVHLLLDAHMSGVSGYVDVGAGGDGPSEGLLAFRARVRDDVGRLLLSHRDRIDHPDPEAAVRVLVRVLEAAIPALTDPHALDRDGSGRQEASDPRIPEASPAPAQELHRLALGYLGRPRRTGEREDRVDFFDVWG